MTDSINVAIILGAAKEGRHSEKVLPGVIAAAKERGWDITQIDVRDHPQQLTDREAGDDVFRSQLASADAFVIVTPEYNSSYPGELKLLIDRQHGEFAHKPVGLVTVSADTTDGARVSLSLLPVLTSIRAVVVQPPVQIRDIRDSEALPTNRPARSVPLWRSVSSEFRREIQQWRHGPFRSGRGRGVLRTPGRRA